MKCLHSMYKIIYALALLTCLTSHAMDDYSTIMRLAKPGDNIPSQQQYLKNLVLRQAIKDKNPQAIEEALQKGANVNAVYLHWAFPQLNEYRSYLSQAYCARIAGVLIAAGAPVDIFSLIATATRHYSSANLMELYVKHDIQQKTRLLHATLYSSNILHWLALEAKNYMSISKLLRKVSTIFGALTNREALALLEAPGRYGHLPESLCGSLHIESSRILAAYFHNKRIALQKALVKGELL